MDLRLIRNATLRLRFAGTEFLIDPMLGVKGSIRAMGDSTERNPTVDLPCPIDDVLEGLDVVLVSHLHPDHFDEAAFGVVPRDLPVFCQPGDTDKLSAAGFSSTALDGPTRIGRAEVTPVAASHGAGSIVERMGPVLGLVFRADDEPTLYWTGDTILCDPVRDTLSAVQPKVIVTHSGGATAAGQMIIMGVADTLEVAQTAPSATVIAVHLEAVGHAPVTRPALRQEASAAGIESTQLRIPADGETITITLT
jgi:L-ascorbate metabolism protein UlaG (beta-lactamase superfamily)